jgi:acyl-CoA reductase-like NAD-dependent aldehyde dehydrogenase
MAGGKGADGKGGGLAAILDQAERALAQFKRSPVRHFIAGEAVALPTPFGDMKASGIGRDGGDYSFDFYMETKNVAVAYDTHKVPRIGG